MMAVEVRIPAALASFAHRSGEESELIVFRVARALDRHSGTGRVAEGCLVEACGAAFSRKQTLRVLHGGAGRRYWVLDGDSVVLRSGRKILESFSLEPYDSLAARSFDLSLLNTRPRRGAALLAAITAAEGAPRSLRERRVPGPSCPDFRELIAEPSAGG
jgi:hypothetical protein